MKFGHLILRKIIKFVATRCQILRLNAPNWLQLGSAQYPAGGGYSTLPDTLAGLKGPTSKGRESNEKGWKGGGREERGDPRPGLGNWKGGDPT